MEDTEPTARGTTRGKDGTQEMDNTVLLSSKPLHRFIRGEPQILGVVVLIFGCAELLMGFQLARDRHENSTLIYIPFWQGALFLISGNLSIYTGLHPSKRMVTVCLAMYVVSLLGILVSIGYRIFCLVELSYIRFMYGPYIEKEWTYNRFAQLFSIEAILFISSVCVSALLIFLSAVARLALKSTNTQVLVQHALTARSNTVST
ncbi:membrane-spanning 4-domains subfamily A member 4D-like [Centroberyx affinis]|uniref:membrane-spanning 4-domains subfamily A member 4D-like n=1 Tax=Centroberyx affinis TaxID=166261 RepID=UPI003A5C1730